MSDQKKGLPTDGQETKAPKAEKSWDGITVSGVKYATADELNGSMKDVEARVRRETIAGRNGNPDRDRYSVELRFDKLVRYTAQINSDLFGLVAAVQDSPYVGHEIKTMAKYRIVKTVFAPNADGSENCQSRIDVYLNQYVRLTYVIDKDAPFLQLYSIRAGEQFPGCVIVRKAQAKELPVATAVEE